MSTAPHPPSIHAIQPPTIGGTPARKGFNLQDHVTAAYCIRMIQEAQLLEVWCEAHDDIVVIWATPSGQEVEFVQVKSHELEQLWSVAKLCEQDGSSSATKGTSIVERSLAQHRCAEQCRFRIVTCRPVMDPLKPLTLKLESTARVASKPDLDNLGVILKAKVKDYLSPNGGDCLFWVHRTYWEVIHSIESVMSSNRLMLARELEKIGHVLMTDQVQELYMKLVRLVFDAALATDANEKKLKRSDILKWINETANALGFPSPIGGTKMTEKMTMAGLSNDTIEAAKAARLFYRRKALAERYSAPLDYEVVEAEVSATLNMLRARLDTGFYADNGIAFHKTCLDALGEIHSSKEPAQKLGLAFLHGCMYSITDRCGHRFRSVTA